jgi:hypothetical protein
VSCKRAALWWAGARKASLVRPYVCPQTLEWSKRNGVVTELHAGFASAVVIEEPAAISLPRAAISLWSRTDSHDRESARHFNVDPRLSTGLLEHGLQQGNCFARPAPILDHVD